MPARFITWRKYGETLKCGPANVTSPATAPMIHVSERCLWSGIPADFIDIHVLSTDLHPVGSFLAHEPVGLEPQHKNQYHERHRVFITGGNVAGEKKLRHAQKQSAEDGAGNAAETADDRRAECLERHLRAHFRRDEEDRS